LKKKTFKDQESTEYIEHILRPLIEQPSCWFAEVLNILNAYRRHDQTSHNAPAGARRCSKNWRIPSLELLGDISLGLRK